MSEAERHVEVHEEKLVFNGFFKISQAVLSYSRVNGQGKMENVTRLVFERGDSVAVLVHDVERNVIILAEQFRYPTLKKTGGWIVELPAGSLPAEESPRACLVRELREELGYAVGEDDLEFVANVFMSPGGTSERIYIYYVQVKPAHKVDPDASGVAEEQEDIRAVELPLRTFLDQCQEGVLTDAKTVLAGLWLAVKGEKAKKPKPRSRKKG